MILKGFQPEEAEPEPKVDSAQILKQYREKKASANASMKDWDDLEGHWNPDGTLSKLTASKNGEILYELDFVWNANGTFSKAMRKS